MDGTQTHGAIPPRRSRRAVRSAERLIMLLDIGKKILDRSSTRTLRSTLFGSNL
ncbi:hypothetical protein KIN20_023347 [Parelaphostrongylus tenuis]|uniref:Uncharacterized protein n=1 Tax=Parelaphostrongylus tenuis TaxID=148309 RepID=A0AAD5MVH8_PARTN|nr:hypothetical protein KIN20_023347 [Parelaphostrongylus tenuis]